HHAAAAAVCLLAVLGLGLSLPAEDNSEADFTLCSNCFYRQTPPQGSSAGPLLRPRCHRLPGGQAFATLSRPTCDTAVYSAFHLGQGWTEREGEEGREPKQEIEMFLLLLLAAPALLRGGADPSHSVSPTDSPFHHWDSTVTTLVQSSVSPQCSTVGGDLYILTGLGGLGAAEDGDEECQTKLLWSAACCAVPQGKGGFSVGLIRETEEGVRQVSVKELEDIVGLHSEGLPGNTEAVAAETSADAATSESGGNEQGDVTRSGAVRSDSDSSAEHETAEETDTNSTSTLVSILSITFSIFKFPLRPVFSTITQLPEQVTYVLQEDLGVLSTLPGETFTLLHLLTSDLLSWMGTAGEMLLGIGETCFCSVYYCTSSMMGELLSSCHIGVTGLGTLAGDTVGVFGDALDNAWSVTKFFGGRLWEQSEGYMGTVMSEMGGQAQAVGGGFGRLVWRSGKGVINVFRLGGGVIFGMVDVVFGGVREAFGQEANEE
uniref:INO80 complex subunit E n=1 Tax=Oreochromis niloticus TaxID=8128 RepID=A0A669EST0_ORENI